MKMGIMNKYNRENWDNGDPKNVKGLKTQESQSEQKINLERENVLENTFSEHLHIKKLLFLKAMLYNINSQSKLNF